MVKEINEIEVEKILKEGKNKIIIDCYAPWCGPCKMLSPIIDELAKEISDYDFYKINVDDAPNLSEKYEIMSIPTLLIFKNDKLENKLIGLKSKSEIKELLK